MGPDLIFGGSETDKLIAVKEHVLSLMESETAPHMHIYSWVEECTSVHFEKQAERNTMPPKWSQPNEPGSYEILKKKVSPQADKERTKILTNTEFSVDFQLTIRANLDSLSGFVYFWK